jgi:glycosyltransferase involved in cell wall biosynthesis
MTVPGGRVAYSVIVPILNEAGAIAGVHEGLRAVMDRLGQPYEIIIVDDDSQDSGVEALRPLLASSGSLVLARLASHAGQAAALQAGLDLARGEVCITMDGDGQQDPQDIPRLLEKMREGWDMVCGWRTDRRDPWRRKAAAWAARLVRRLATKDAIRDAGCSLRAFRREAAAGLNLSRGLHRFFPVLMARKGCRIAEIPVAHHPRRAGASKYGVWDRLPEAASDLFRVLFWSEARLMPRQRRYRIREILRGAKA